MDLSNYFNGWGDEDTHTHIYKRELLGIHSLNKMNNNEFKKKLCEYLNLIKKVKIDSKELYWKHDINNGLFTLLQLNKNLQEEKNNLINLMREQLWIVDEEDYIEHNLIVKIIMNV